MKVTKMSQEYTVTAVEKLDKLDKLYLNSGEFIVHVPSELSITENTKLDIQIYENEEDITSEDTETGEETDSSEQNRVIDNEDQGDEIENVLNISPNAIFTYKQVSWNEYVFQAQIPEDPNYRVEWEFGDGVSSNKTEVTHLYRGYGEYIVNVRVVDPEGEVSEDSSTVMVPFLTLENIYIKLLIGILILLIIVGIIIVFKISNLSRDHDNDDELDDDELEQEDESVGSNNNDDIEHNNIKKKKHIQIRVIDENE